MAESSLFSGSHFKERESGKMLHSPDIKRFLGRNYAGLKKPLKKKLLGGEARGFGGFCIFAGEEVALAVSAELGSAGLLSWRQRWCPHQREGGGRKQLVLRFAF